MPPVCVTVTVPLHCPQLAGVDVVLMLKLLTVTITLSVAVQPSRVVTVTQYWVVAEGHAEGFGKLVALRPAEGDHE